MRYRDKGPGWVFLPVFLLTIILIIFTLALPSGALEVVECPDPARPIHYSVLCLSEAEFADLTAPKPPPAPPTPVFVDPVGLVRVIAYYFWPDWAAERMIRIARCESSYVTTAVNPRSGTTGLWQIHPLWQKKWPGDYKNPWTNGAVAYQVWLEQGWGAWACKG